MFGCVFSKFHSQYSAALDIVSYIYGNKLFIRTSCDRTSDRTKQTSICFKLKEGQFRLATRHNFFTMKGNKTMSQTVQKNAG